jgi:hypothetical protein
MGLKVQIADDPLMCVMRGLIEILRRRELYEQLIANSRVHASLEERR